ncbi:MAG: precorrin-6y C5,15-methyltransferase (decarboxylating) subunit CbiE [Desulfatiglandales bacterium]
MGSVCSKVYVLGIGYSPLSERAKEVLRSSANILTSTRLMEVFKTYPIFSELKDKVSVIDGVDNTLEFLREWIAQRSSGIVVLASGDPMFYGIGRRISQELGKENVVIIPELSSIQLAFARIKEPWDNAFLMSVHGGPYPKRRINRYGVEDIPYFLNLYGRLCILTDPQNNPKLIAHTLYRFFDRGEGIRMYVAERLGYEDERIISGSPQELKEKEFRDPNVVILIMDGHRPSKRFGFRGNEISHEEGLITKDEVRAVILHKIAPPQKGVFWDIGAGSGSISLEISSLFPELEVFAVEKDSRMSKHLLENLRRYKARYRIVEGEAPEALNSLPHPDRVFVGGSGGRLNDILGYLRDQRVGHMVFVATLFESLNLILRGLSGDLYEVEVVQLSAHISKPLSNSWYLVSQNPVFVITARER